MLEIEALSLRPGDEFTADEGATWHTCESASPNEKRVVEVWCVGESKPLFLALDASVIVR